MPPRRHNRPYICPTFSDSLHSTSFRLAIPVRFGPLRFAVQHGSISHLWIILLTALYDLHVVFRLHPSRSFQDDLFQRLIHHVGPGRLPVPLVIAAEPHVYVHLAWFVKCTKGYPVRQKHGC